MPEAPAVRYAKSGDVRVAYTVSGEGPLDVVFIANWDTPLEARWDEPIMARHLHRLESFGRLICFDKRGVGCSDPARFDDVATPEEWTDDVFTVMDAVGSDSAALIAVGDSGPMAMLSAATHPERVSALVLFNTCARMKRADDYPIGFPPDVEEWVLKGVPHDWEHGVVFETVAPSLVYDERIRRWWARNRRLQGSPAIGRALSRMVISVDVRSVLPTIQAPTLVLHRRDNRWTRVDHARYLSDKIPGAKLVELAGADDQWWAGDTDAVFDEIEGFLTGVRRGAEPDRVLVAVLFTDIVDSTSRAAEIGDRAWRSLLDQHDAVARLAVDRYRGRLVKSTGDGLLATFDGPARAIRCASAIVNDAAALGLEVRSGIHAGEIELRGSDIGGIAVHVCSRVAAAANAGETMVSETVPALVAGSGIEFESRGVHTLKGIPEALELLVVRRS